MFVRLLLVTLVVGLVGCGGATKPALTGDAVRDSLTKAGLPASDVRVFTAETDPNKLLGRPNQYTAKVSWKDPRAGADDATVEMFASAADLKARQQYTETISRAASALAQYIYANEARLALLRLPHQLTPEQAKPYQDWLATL